MICAQQGDQVIALIRLQQVRAGEDLVDGQAGVQELPVPAADERGYLGDRVVAAGNEPGGAGYG
jgi:hypothetical protein